MNRPTQQGVRRRAPRAERQVVSSAAHRLRIMLVRTTPGAGLRPRRDPRRERALVRGPSGRPRRAAGCAVLAAAQPAVAAAPPLRSITAPDRWILVVPDLYEGRLSVQDRDLLGLAQTLAAHGTGVAAVTFEPTREALGAAGADRIIDLGASVPSGYAPDARAAAVARIVRALDPWRVLLPESDYGGADLGRRLAACLEEAVVTDALRVGPDRATRALAARGLQREHALARLVLVAPDEGDAYSGPAAEALALPAPIALEPTRIRDLGNARYDAGAVRLEDADFILAAGNGVRDFELFHRLASALGATEAGSRVVIDAGLLPRERQVGATGALVSARCYLALGISGAPQHLQGITQCEHVIAVNMDAGCDMMRRADLGVVADVHALMQALLERLGPP